MKIRKSPKVLQIYILSNGNVCNSWFWLPTCRNLEHSRKHSSDFVCKDLFLLTGSWHPACKVLGCYQEVNHNCFVLIQIFCCCCLLMTPEISLLAFQWELYSNTHHIVELPDFLTVDWCYLNIQLFQLNSHRFFWFFISQVPWLKYLALTNE